MQDFSIKLDSKEYRVSSTSSNGKGERSYDISFDHGGISTNIRIPIEKKATRARVILFIEAFHEGLKAAFDAQGIDQNYVWNQKVTMV